MGSWQESRAYLISPFFMPKILRNEKGMALLITILVISLLFGLTVRFHKKMLTHLESATNLRDGVKLDYMTKTAFNAARAVLRADAQDNSYDSFHDDWAKLSMLAAGSAYFFDQGRLTVSVDDHSGRIQLNALVKRGKGKVKRSEKQIALLKNLLALEEFGLEAEQVENISDAILDWLDPDDNPSGFGGAEQSYYNSLDPPYSCGNKPLEFVEDLLYIRGIDRKILYGSDDSKGIFNYLTTFGEDGRVNINTADPLVLMALAGTIDMETAIGMEEYRDDEDNEAELSSTNWYKRVPLFPGDITIDPDLIGVKSSYFVVKAGGAMDSMHRVVEGVIHRLADKTTEVISWQKE